MSHLLGLFPSLLVLALVLLFRCPALLAAAASVAAALAVGSLGVFAPLTPELVLSAAADAGLVALVLASVVVPGFAFITATASTGSTDALRNLVDAAPLSPPMRAVLVVCGLGVLVESLTGMGVSLLITVPILARLFAGWRVLALALIGMSLMPWGALSLAALVGAKLGGIEPSAFAFELWLMSGAVAALLPMLAVLCAGSTRPADYLLALCTGGAMWAATGWASFLLGVEAAGVLGGLAVLVLLLAMTGAQREIAAALRHQGLRPYAILIAAVVAQKALVALAPWIAEALVIRSVNLSVAPLTLPGLALVAAVTITARQPYRGLIEGTLQRSWRPLLTAAMFLICARLLVECGAIAALAGATASLGPHAALLATGALGAVGGFITGSGISANALFLPAAATTGLSFGQAELFAVLSNAASGHTAMASLPIIALLIAALPDRTQSQERDAMRIGLALAAFHVGVVTGIAYLRL